MIGSLLMMLALLNRSVQGDPGGVTAILATGDYRKAWDSASSLTNPNERARAMSKILYDAGDPAGAWNCAQAGLVVSPGQLDLLYYSAAAALWLQAPEACEMTERLRSVVHAAADLQSHEENAAWQAVSVDFGRRCGALRLHEEALAKAVSLAQGLSLSVGALALGVALAGARHYGRSRRPVS